jgi:hypothetical protein
VKIKPKGKNVTSSLKAPPSKSAELRGWPAIAQFLGMPNSTVHRWAKEGMPVRRESRNVVASPEELNRWLQRTSGEAAGVHVATSGADLIKDLRASLAAQSSAHQPRNKREQRPGAKPSKTKSLA